MKNDMPRKDNTHHDTKLSSSLRKLERQLLEWADLIERNKMDQRKINQMRQESRNLQKLMSEKEI